MHCVVFLTLFFWPPSDIGELFLWPELWADQSDAASAHPDRGHLHTGSLGRLLHHLPLPGCLPRHKGPNSGSSSGYIVQMPCLIVFHVTIRKEWRWSQGLFLGNIFPRMLPSVRWKTSFWRPFLLPQYLMFLFVYSATNHVRRRC